MRSRIETRSAMTSVAENRTDRNNPTRAPAVIGLIYITYSNKLRLNDY